jgi:hypothetical protein
LWWALGDSNADLSRVKAGTTSDPALPNSLVRVPIGPSERPAVPAPCREIAGRARRFGVQRLSKIAVSACCVALDKARQAWFDVRAQ